MSCSKNDRPAAGRSNTRVSEICETPTRRVTRAHPRGSAARAAACASARRSFSTAPEPSRSQIRCSAAGSSPISEAVVQGGVGDAEPFALPLCLGMPVQPNPHRPGTGRGQTGGDRIRTCDLWVISQPVAVSNRPSGLKGAGHAESPVAAMGRVSLDRGSYAAFRSQIRSQHCTQQVHQPRRLTAVDSAASSGQCFSPRRARSERPTTRTTDPVNAVGSRSVPPLALPARCSVC